MVHGFNVKAALKLIMECVLEESVPVILCTDLKSLYNCLVKPSITLEKCLMINIICL